MTDPPAILRDLARAKAIFQLRAITAVIGAPAAALRSHDERVQPLNHRRAADGYAHEDHVGKPLHTSGDML